MKKIKNTEAKKLYDELHYCFNFLSISRTFLAFHGRPSEQLENCIKQIEKASDRVLNTLCKYEDKYWSEK